MQLSRLLSILALGAALYLVPTQPGWSFLQFVGFALLGWSEPTTLGGLGAFFAVTLGLALQGMDMHGESAITRVLLPLWATFAMGGVLACLVARRPSLGKRIELGPMGPGGR